LPDPLVEDWSFHFIGEHFVLQRLFEGPITSRVQYDELRNKWNAEANRIGKLALLKRPDLFRNNPVRADHEPGTILANLGFVDLDKDSGSLSLTPSGASLTRLLFQNPPSYHRALLLILFTEEERAYFAERPGHEVPSFFAGLLGMDIWVARVYFDWLAEHGWTSGTYGLDFYTRKLPFLSEPGKAEAGRLLQALATGLKSEAGKAASDEASPAPVSGEKKWWERPIGIVALGIAVTVVGGLILWGITRRYDRPQPATGTVPQAKTIGEPEAVRSGPRPSQDTGKEASLPLEGTGKTTDKSSVAAPTTRSPRVAISAPNGIAIGGNNNGTATVNNLGPPSRRPTSQQRDLLASILSAHAGKIKVWAVSSDNDAMLLGQDLYDVLKASGWQVGGSGPEAVLQTQPSTADVYVFIHSEPGEQGSFSTRDPAAVNLVKALKSLGLTLELGRSEKVPMGVLKIVVNARSPR
jgi:hypothetical protein